MLFPEKRHIGDAILTAVYSYENALGTRPTILYVSPRLLDNIMRDGSRFYTQTDAKKCSITPKYLGLTVVRVDEWCDELRFDVGVERKFV